jgi:hypothetical protein
MQRRGRRHLDEIPRWCREMMRWQQDPRERGRVSRVWARVPCRGERTEAKSQLTRLFEARSPSGASSKARPLQGGQGTENGLDHSEPRADKRQGCSLERTEAGVRRTPSFYGVRCRTKQENLPRCKKKWAWLSTMSSKICLLLVPSRSYAAHKPAVDIWMHSVGQGSSDERGNIAGRENVT